MHTAFLTTAFVTLLCCSIAHANRPVVEVRLVATAGTEFPTREGSRVRLGPSLVVPPLQIASATATGSAVQLLLAPEAAAAFAEVTAKNVGRQLAIVIDGVVQATPTIRDAIKEGKVSVTVRSPEMAQKLASALTTK
jgi:hypothetical protein